MGPQQRTEIYSRIEAARQVLRQQREAYREGGAQLAEAEGGGGDAAGQPAANGSSQHLANGSASEAASSSAYSGPDWPSPRSGGYAELAADEEFAEAMSEVRRRAFFVC